MTAGSPTDDDVTRALATARALGFLGPGPVEDHVRHALAFVEAVQGADPGVGLDLGSGGGVPGLVLAARLPDWRWVLLDAAERRIAFLQATVLDLGLADRVEVVRGRSEEIGHEPAHRGAYDVVTARSYGSPPATAEAAAPLLRVGGALVVSEPPDSDARWPTEVLEVGLQYERRTQDVGGVAVLRQVAPCPQRFPRRWAVQQRTPLFPVSRET